MSALVRGVERRIHADGHRHRASFWAIPAAGFAVWVTILVVAGVMTGIWAAEYIPVALLQGAVIAGLLFVAGMPPDTVPPETNDGDGGPGLEPSSAPPGGGQTVWVTLLAELDSETASADPNGEQEVVRAPAAR